MIDSLKKAAPETRIVCILSTALSTQINEGYKTACQYYNVESIALTEIDMMNGHPTIVGMEQIKNQIIESLTE